MNNEFSNVGCRGPQNFVRRGALIAALCSGLLAVSGVYGAPGSRPRPAARGDNSKAALAQTPQTRNARQSAPEAVPATYDNLVQEAKRQLANHQPQQAHTAAERAIRVDGERYEAHLIAAAALRDQKQYPQATQHVQTALALAPDGAKPAILRAATEVRMAGLPPDARRRLDALMLVAEETDKVAPSNERAKLLREFMVRSTAFLDEYSFVAELWLLRATAALELDYPELGWIAARQLAELGFVDSEDLSVRQVMAQLERKQWIGREYAREDFSKRTIDAVKTAAEGGDADCELVMGECFEWGQAGLQKNPLEAAKWYRKAAEQGSAAARSHLAFLFENGLGVAKDDAEAVRWSRKAANLGNGNRQIALGKAYQSGLGVVRDPAEAVRWYRKAAAQDYPWAERLLGLAYRRGEGVTRDEAAGMRWYRSAAQHAREQEDAELENNLAWAFATDPDPLARHGAEAVQLALAACEATSYQKDYIVDTLAAAYAETGDWNKAVATQQKAIEVLRNAGPEREAKYLTDFQARLELYRSKQPYRERPE